MNEIDDLKAKARDFYWKYTAATTISSSSDAGLDRDAALPRECSQISLPGTEFRVMFLALGVSTAIAGPPLVFVASWVGLDQAWECLPGTWSTRYKYNYKSLVWLPVQYCQ